MQFVPVIDIEITDNDKYKINGREKNDKFDDALKTLQIPHKKSYKKRKVVDLKTRILKILNSENDVKGVNARHKIWHRIAMIDDTSGKTGVDIISLSKFDLVTHSSKNLNKQYF